MLGLADEIGRDMHRIGGVVGEYRDLGGAGFGVDADNAAHQSLGCGDVDVARAGDDVHALDAEVRIAVGGQRDRLRPAGCVDLGDAEQRARGECCRVRTAVELFCGGVKTATDSTPATCAGTTFITTLDG